MDRPDWAIRTKELAAAAALAAQRARVCIVCGSDALGTMVALECGHELHQRCFVSAGVHQWLQCPLCQLPVTEVKFRVEPSAAPLSVPAATAAAAAAAATQRQVAGMSSMDMLEARMASLALAQGLVPVVMPMAPHHAGLLPGAEYLYRGAPVQAMQPLQALPGMPSMSALHAAAAAAAAAGATVSGTALATAQQLPPYFPPHTHAHAVPPQQHPPQSPQHHHHHQPQQQQQQQARPQASAQPHTVAAAVPARSMQHQSAASAASVGSVGSPAGAAKDDGDYHLF